MIMADELAIALIGIIITACLTVIGWNVTHFLGKRREMQIRVLEITLKRAENQIEELYGPLYSLVNQLFVIWDTEDRLNEIFQNKSLKEKYKITDDIPGKIEIYFKETHYFPIYNRIRELFSTKLYLLENAEIPNSFQQYLDYSTQEYIQHKIWQDRNISTEYLHGLDWPDSLEEDIKQELKKIMEIYYAALKSIRHIKTKKKRTETNVK